MTTPKTEATKWSSLLCCALALFAQSELTQAANKTAALPGNTWAAIAKLPDWSGTWALDVAGHEFASKETRPDDGGLVPLTPKYQELRANMMRNKLPESLSQCLPAGIPGLMLHRIAMEFLFSPGRFTILSENGEVRRIHTDGRAHLSLDELETSFEGDSTAHWEGQTLVVDTIGFPKGSLFKNGGLTTTKHTHYVERMFLKDKDHLQIDSAISDPAIFTKPYLATRVYERIDYPILEPQCAEASRDGEDGLNLKPPADDEE